MKEIGTIMSEVKANTQNRYLIVISTLLKHLIVLVGTSFKLGPYCQIG